MFLTTVENENVCSQGETDKASELPSCLLHGRLPFRVPDIAGGRWGASSTRPCTLVQKTRKRTDLHLPALGGHGQAASPGCDRANKRPGAGKPRKWLEVAQTLRRHPAPPHTSGPLTDRYSLRRSLSRHRTRDRLRRYDQGAGGWDAGARPLPSPWSREKRAATWAAGGATGGPACASDHPTRHPRPRSPRATRSRHRHAVVSTCAREARGSEGDRVLGAEARFPKSEGGDGGRRHAFLSAEGATQASVPAAPPRDGAPATRLGWLRNHHLSSVTAVTPNSSQPEGSVTHFTLQEMLGFCT